MEKDFVKDLDEVSVAHYHDRLRVETLKREVDRLNEVVQAQRETIADLNLAVATMRRRVESLEGVT